MNQDIFNALFQLQDSRLAKLGNPLIEIDKILEWTDCKVHLDLVHEKKRKSNAGAKPKSVLIMFKGLSVHNSQVFEDILNKTNTNKSVWADSVYKSKEQEETLLKKGYRSHIQRKGKRGKSLSKLEIKGNNNRSKTRSRVEHIFGSMTDLRKKSVRCIVIQRAKTEIGLMNLVYNIRRMCFLCRENPF